METIISISNISLESTNPQVHAVREFILLQIFVNMMYTLTTNYPNVKTCIEHKYSTYLEQITLCIKIGINTITYKIPHSQSIHNIDKILDRVFQIILSREIIECPVCYNSIMYELTP